MAVIPVICAGNATGRICGLRGCALGGMWSRRMPGLCVPVCGAGTSGSGMHVYGESSHLSPGANGGWMCDGGRGLNIVHGPDEDVQNAWGWRGLCPPLIPFSPFLIIPMTSSSRKQPYNTVTVTAYTVAVTVPYGLWTTLYGYGTVRLFFVYLQELRISVVTPAGSPSQYYETPHPSALTEEQKFKLNSSRGSPMHPDQFSPLPVVRPITGSRKLKENRSRRIPKKDSASLASPFNSRPSSACTSPQKPDFALEHRLFKRTLSDKNYSPTIPQSASTTNSPAHSPARLRPPSAPSPPRPAWVSKDMPFNFYSANPFFLPSPTNDIDFNRPPSSLSFYGDADPQLFDIPALMDSAFTLGSALADDDDDDDAEHRERGLPGAMDVDFSWGLKPASMRERSPWLSDTAVSPQECIQHDVDMCDVPPAFGLAAFVPSGEEDQAFHGDLKQMFDGLALGIFPPTFLPSFSPLVTYSYSSLPYFTRRFNSSLISSFFYQGPKSHGLPSRTRSLDSAAIDDDSPTAKPKGRDRRGTIRASDFPSNTGLGLARRTRSGTVIGPPSRNNDGSHVDGYSPGRKGKGEDSIGEVDEDEELGGWCGDGWAVAAPPSPVVSRIRPRKQMHSPRLVGSGSGSGLLPSPILQRTRREREPEAVLEEEEDELLLKPGFNAWE
ncbi:hypothetical protein C8R43DRAFT_1106941 [Mycena crocata]|nr:hypothetical protein C8R43DRAFT_1106941 [Mycena crocata]